MLVGQSYRFEPSFRKIFGEAPYEAEKQSHYCEHQALCFNELWASEFLYGSVTVLSIVFKVYYWSFLLIMDLQRTLCVFSFLPHKARSGIDLDDVIEDAAIALLSRHYCTLSKEMKIHSLVFNYLLKQQFLMIISLRKNSSRKPFWVQKTSISGIHLTEKDKNIMTRRHETGGVCPRAYEGRPCVISERIKSIITKSNGDLMAWLEVDFKQIITVLECSIWLSSFLIRLVQRYIFSCSGSRDVQN